MLNYHYWNLTKGGKVKKNKMNKIGNTVLTMPLVIGISFTLIITLCVFSINLIIPFVWYQKLQIISYKYMYIIEKYGCLTISERNMLIDELESKGFDKSQIKVDAPSSPRNYGELVEFKIHYNYKQKLPSLDGNFKMMTKYIPINIEKVIVSKF